MAATPQKRDTVQRRLLDMERRLKTLETASRLRSASIGEGGLRVYDGGSVIVEPDGEIKIVDENGKTVAGFGYLDGTNARGIVAYDRGGSRVLFAGDDSESGNLSPFTVWDSAGNPMFRLDPGGEGIAAPRVAIPLYKWRDQNGARNDPSTSSTTEQLLFSGRFPLHWPIIEWSLVSRLTAGTSEALRVAVEYPVGTEVRSRQQTFNATAQTWDDFFDVSDLVSESGGQVVTVNIWGSRTGGSAGQTVGATLQGLYGRGT